MKTFSVLSWNIQGSQTRWYGTSFRRVMPVLSQATADVVCLQEFSNAAEKLQAMPNLGEYKYVFIPKRNGLEDHFIHGYNHNVLLSKYPLHDVTEITFPPHMSPKGALENAIRADVQIGDQRVRIYLCHLAVVGAGVVTRLWQLRYIMAQARKFSGPTIICGDMNAAMPQGSFGRLLVKLWHGWSTAEMRPQNKRIVVPEALMHHAEVVQYGFRELLDLSQATWSPFRTSWFELFKLKLDWFFIKKLNAVKVELGDYISDHRHVQVVCSLDS